MTELDELAVKVDSLPMPTAPVARSASWPTDASVKDFSDLHAGTIMRWKQDGVATCGVVMGAVLGDDRVVVSPLPSLVVGGITAAWADAHVEAFMPNFFQKGDDQGHFFQEVVTPAGKVRLSLVGDGAAPWTVSVCLSGMAAPQEGRSITSVLGNGFIAKACQNRWQLWTPRAAAGFWAAPGPFNPPSLRGSEAWAALVGLLFQAGSLGEPSPWLVAPLDPLTSMIPQDWSLARAAAIAATNLVAALAGRPARATRLMAAFLSDSPAASAAILAAAHLVHRIAPTGSQGRVAILADFLEAAQILGSTPGVLAGLIRQAWVPAPPPQADPLAGVPDGAVRALDFSPPLGGAQPLALMPPSGGSTGGGSSSGTQATQVVTARAVHSLGFATPAQAGGLDDDPAEEHRDVAGVAAAAAAVAAASEAAASAAALAARQPVRRSRYPGVSQRVCL